MGRFCMFALAVVVAMGPSALIGSAAEPKQSSLPPRFPSTAPGLPPFEQPLTVLFKFRGFEVSTEGLDALRKSSLPSDVVETLMGGTRHLTDAEANSLAGELDKLAKQDSAKPLKLPENLGTTHGRSLKLAWDTTRADAPSNRLETDDSAVSTLLGVELVISPFVIGPETIRIVARAREGQGADVQGVGRNVPVHSQIAVREYRWSQDVKAGQAMAMCLRDVAPKAGGSPEANQPKSAQMVLATPFVMENPPAPAAAAQVRPETTEPAPAVTERHVLLRFHLFQVDADRLEDLVKALFSFETEGLNAVGFEEASVRDAQKLVDQLHLLTKQKQAKILTESSLVTADKRPARFMSGDYAELPPAAADGPPISKFVGTDIIAVPLIFEDTKVRLELRLRTTSMDKGDGPMADGAAPAPPKFRAAEINTGYELKQGQAVLLNGIRQRAPATAPGEAEKEVEHVLLVTTEILPAGVARILSPDAWESIGVVPQFAPKPSSTLPR